MNAWAWLVTSVAAEVGGTLALRASDGLTRPLATLGVAVGYVVAIAAMARSVRTLDLGLAYAVWAGSGTALTALIGMSLFDEGHGTLRLAGLACIVAGVVLLHASA